MSFGTGNAQLEAYLLQVEQRMQSLEEGQACRDPQLTNGFGINTPIIDGQGNVGRLSDLFVLGGTALGDDRKQVLRLRDEIEIQDRRGKSGVEKHVVLEEALKGFATPAFI